MTEAASGSASSRRRGWWARVKESVESRLWPLPLIAVLVAVALGIVLPSVDAIVDSSLPQAVDSAVFNGGADTARSVLSSIAGSLITATSLTFSLTVIALQLASSQASPRVLRLFARDRQVHWTLAMFLGTFAYSVTVLRSVRSADDQVSEVVPRISVTLAFVLTLVSVIMLVFFLAHLAAELRVETMLKNIHAETDRTIDIVGELNESATAYHGPIRIPSDRRTVISTSSGFVNGHDHDALVDYAAEQGIVVQEVVPIGANIISGMPLAHWWPPEDATRPNSRRSPGASPDEVEKAIRGSYSIGYERVAATDVAYGIQQIVDIGLRALSPSTNDPTTATHALGHLTAVTARQLAMPRLPDGLSGPDGQLCVITATPSVREHIDTALTPIRNGGADQPALVRRFVQAVSELFSLTDDPEAHAALLSQLDALERQLEEQTSDPALTDELLSLTRKVTDDLRRESAGRA